MPKWKWTKYGQFSIKFMYDHMSDVGSNWSSWRLWKAKIPAKIKIRLLLIWHNVVVIKDNMVKRNWTGDPFCFTKPESINHLFFGYSPAKYVCGIVCNCNGASSRPDHLSQYF